MQGKFGAKISEPNYKLSIRTGKIRLISHDEILLKKKSDDQGLLSKSKQAV
jgi:hypothetical protein